MTVSKKTKRPAGHSPESEITGVSGDGGSSGGWLVWVLLLAGLLTTGLAVWQSKSEVESGAEKEFESVCNDIRGKVLDRLNAHEQILRSAEAFVEHSDGVSRQEWKTFTDRQRIEQQLPGIQGIGFALLIPRERLEQHIQDVRAEGFPGYRVWPEGDRQTYSAIIYLEPFTNRNLRAFGYDMLSEPIRREAMELARDQGAAALSGKITLVQETDKDIQAGTLMYVPVYRAGMPCATVAQRRATLSGWVYSPYRMNDLMQGILGRWDLANVRRIHLEVFDGRQICSAALLYDSQSAGKDSPLPADRITFQPPIVYAGRNWTLLFSRSATPLNSAEYANVWGTAAGGIIVSLLLVGLLVTLQNIRLAAKQLADRLMKDLQQTSDRLALAASAGGVGIWGYEVASNELIWDDQMFALYGITRAQFSGAYEAWTAGVHPEDRQRGDEEIKMALRGEKEFDTEFRVLWSDGTVRYIRALARVHRDASGRPLRMIGTNWDITAQKQLEAALRASESQTNQLLQNTDQGIYGIDLNGCCTFMNQSGLKILGYQPEDCFGQNMHDLIHHSRSDGSSYPVQDCPVFRAKMTGEGSRVDSEVLWRKDGTSFSAEYSSYPIVRDGEIRGAVVTFSDITERKQAEATLSMRESYLSAIIENQSGLIWLKDADSRFLAVNKAFAISCGKQQSSDLAGLTDLDIWPRELAEKYRKDDFSVMELRKPVIVEEQVYDQGLPRWFETYKTPVFDGQGAVIGTTGCARDITQRKEMEAALSRQKTLLSNLLDSIPDIVFFKDIEGVYLGCNPRFEEFLGRPREEIVGHTDHDLFPKEVADSFRENDRVMMAQNKARHNEEWITYPDGRRILIDTLKAPLADMNGKVVGMLGVSRDITDRKHAEDALEQQSLLQKTLMDIATTYINLPLEEVDHSVQTVLKKMGDFVEADRAYIFSYDFHGGICTNTFEWCCAGILPQMEALQAVPLAELPDWVAAHRRGDAVYYPDVTALPPGGVRDILEPQQIKSLLTIPLTHGDDCLGFIGFDSVRKHHPYSDKERILLTLFAQMLTNVRLRQQNEAALLAATSRANNMADKAAAAAIAKSMFLANMSHEIRTPLNAVLGHAQIMSRECVGCPTASDSLPAIIRSSEHLLELINDILGIVQTDVQDIVLTASDFDFYYLLDSVRVMSGQKRRGAIPVEVVMAPDLPQFLHADKGKIRQVLLNLVGNAIKFAVRGRVCLTAGFCRTGADDGLMLTVDVEDNGHGIEAGQLERIFDLFEQAGSGQQLGKGTGLGLPLSRRYAQALGGNVIVLRSVPGAGSTFRFTFTARQSSPEKTGNAKVARRIAPGQPVPRILAVDDDLENLQMLQFMLEGFGFTVDVAESGASALEKCNGASEFNLILMDKRMPGLDGIETIKRLRKLRDGRKIPVIMVTASELAGEEPGIVDGYVSKPLNRESLLTEIQRLTGVQYEYEKKTVVPQRRNTVMDPDDLLKVPAAQRALLRHAVHSGNLQQMKSVTKDIACGHSEIAAALSEIGRAHV